MFILPPAAFCRCTVPVYVPAAPSSAPPPLPYLPPLLELKSQRHSSGVGGASPALSGARLAPRAAGEIKCGVERLKAGTQLTAVKSVARG